jgi:hypothetical protein
MSEMKLSWGMGIDHISSETNLPDGAVLDALNVDIDRDGNVDRRAGHTLLSTGAAHSLWSSVDGGRSFVVINGVLKAVTYANGAATLTTIRSLEYNARLSYDTLNDSTVACNHAELFTVDPDNNHRLLGLETPGATVAAVTGVGGLDAGRYAVATSYIKGGEEGPLSPAAFVDVVQDGGITVNLTQPNESLPTGIRLYRTGANGDVLMRAADVPLALATWTLGAQTLGRAADTQFKGRMFGGDIVRYWRGRLLVAKGTRVYMSDPMRYGMYDPRDGFLQFPRRVLMMRPVEGGIFFGTTDGVKFYSGSGPTDMTIKDTGGTAPVEGTDTLVSADEFGDIGIKGKFVALWLAANGFIVGQPDGSLISKQSDRIRLPNGATGTGAVVVNSRQAVAVVA